MHQLEVFADVACPFTHVGLRLFRRLREERGAAEPLLRVRAWPLEVVNDTGLDGSALAPKIEALRAGVAPDLFAGFDPSTFPSSTLEAMASEGAAYGVSADVGERFALAVRDALFERGLDVGDADVLAAVRDEVGAPEPSDDDRAAVRADHEEGRGRGVSGSPHFFTPAGDFFCPSLAIEHPDGGLEVHFDEAGYRRFVDAAFA